MKNRFFSLVLLFTIATISCKKDAFEKIPETTVTGSVKEGNSLKPIQKTVRQ